MAVRSEAGPRYATATIDSFELHGEPGQQVRQAAVIGQIREYVQHIGRNIDKGHGVLMSGTCGAGKDHLMIGMVREAIRAGCYDVMWLSAADMFGDAKDALRTSVSMREFLDAWGKPELLVVSDLVPMNQPLTPFEGELLFRLVETRARRLKATWVNFNIGSRQEAVDKIGEKILSRLEQDALVLNLQWSDYRRLPR